MKRSRIVQSLASLVMLMACSAYVWAYMRYNLDEARALAAVTIAGVTALAALAFSLVRPAFHQRVGLFLLGLGAVVASLCAVLFLHYTWTDRDRLADLGLFLILALFALVALGAAVFTWICFWRLALAERAKPKT